MRWMLIILVLGCSADHYSSKGKAALDEHDLAKAEKHFRAGLGRESSHIGSLSGLGWVYLLAGQPDAAAAAFGHCLDVSPKELECLRGSAGVASAKGNPVLARKHLDRAVSLSPHHAGVQSSLALLELAAGDVDAAISRYQTLVDREPQRMEYRLGIAEALIRAKRYEDALAQIEVGLELSDGPKRSRAVLFQAQGRALVAAASRRLDPADCARSSDPVLAWLDAADSAVQSAGAIGVDLPDLPVVKRRVRRQRARVAELCPK